MTSKLVRIQSPGPITYHAILFMRGEPRITREETSESFHIDLHPHADFRITWFFEHWIQWIPKLLNFRTLKMTTSMNLRSEFDADILLVSIFGHLYLFDFLNNEAIRRLGSFE